jgi:hypothetical protein
MPLQKRRASPAQRPAERLRQLARHVERLGIRGWSSPEVFVVAKLTLAGELRQLAKELEG